MHLRSSASLPDGKACSLGLHFQICDDRLLVHAVLDISTNADWQEHKCSMSHFSVDANRVLMDGLEADQLLIRQLCDWANVKPSPMAAAIGVAATTLTRPAGGKATTRISRHTLDLLKQKYPEFPGWNGVSSDSSNASVVKFEGPSIDKPQGNLPVYGTALAAARQVEGDALEQTTLNKAEIVEYVKRPVLLNGRAGAYALHVQGSSMHPALPDGEMVAVSPDMPLSIGDNVVVYLRPDDPDEDDGATARAVLVKELVKRSASFVTLRQYQPAGDFQVPMHQVIRIDRVLSRREMLNG